MHEDQSFFLLCSLVPNAFADYRLSTPRGMCFFNESDQALTPNPIRFESVKKSLVEKNILFDNPTALLIIGGFGLCRSFGDDRRLPETVWVNKAGCIVALGATTVRLFDAWKADQEAQKMRKRLFPYSKEKVTKMGELDEADVEYVNLHTQYTGKTCEELFDDQRNSAWEFRERP